MRVQFRRCVGKPQHRSAIALARVDRLKRRA